MFPFNIDSLRNILVKNIALPTYSLPTFSNNHENTAQDVVLTIFFSILLLLLVTIVSLEIIKAFIYSMNNNLHL